MKDGSGPRSLAAFYFFKTHFLIPEKSNSMNQTALASLILQCILQVLEGNLDTEKNATAKNEPEHKPYDNAYFFILFVMLFYSFLALTVFFGYVRSKKAISKKDPYQEFIEDKDRSKKWNMTRPVVVKFDFEEESIL
ncbi:unnamed protein product [Eretmochelys imbricata]